MHLTQHLSLCIPVDHEVWILAAFVLQNIQTSS